MSRDEIIDTAVMQLERALGIPRDTPPSLGRMQELRAKARVQHSALTGAIDAGRLAFETLHEAQRQSCVRAEMAWPRDCPYR